MGEAGRRAVDIEEALRSGGDGDLPDLAAVDAALAELRGLTPADPGEAVLLRDITGGLMQLRNAVVLAQGDA
jgi:hypothetical protein